MQELEKILEEIESKEFTNMTIRHSMVVKMKDVRSIIRKHMNDGWNPVDKNNIPKNEVLVCDRYENELIGYLSYNADAEEFVCESDECIMHQVIVWMEKPEPYRTERSGE